MKHPLKIAVATSCADGHEPGILTSMSRANCFILLDKECNGISKGEKVNVQPFGALI